MTLNTQFQLPYIPDLLERKLYGTENGMLSDTDITFYQQEYARLCQRLEEARDASHLPDEASCKPTLNDLLLRIRGIS